MLYHLPRLQLISRNLEEKNHFICHSYCFRSTKDRVGTKKPNPQNPNMKKPTWNEMKKIKIKNPKKSRKYLQQKMKNPPKKQPRWVGFFLSKKKRFFQPWPRIVGLSFHNKTFVKHFSIQRVHYILSKSTKPRYDK